MAAQVWVPHADAISELGFVPLPDKACKSYGGSMAGCADLFLSPQTPACLLILESSNKGGEGLGGWQERMGGLGLSPGDHRRNFGWRVGGTSEELLHHAPVSRE